MKLFILVICFASSSFAGLVHHQKIAFRAQPSGITYNSDFSIRSPEPQFIHKTHYAPSYKVQSTSYEPVTKVKAFTPLIAKPYHDHVDHHRYYPYHKPRHTHDTKPSVVVKRPVHFVNPVKVNAVEPVGLYMAREHAVHSVGHAHALGYSAAAPVLVDAPHAHVHPLPHAHAYAAGPAHNVYAPPTIYTVNVKPSFPEVLPLTLVGQPTQVRAQYVPKPKVQQKQEIITDSECFLC